MYEKVNDVRMSSLEASEQYADKYFAMRMDDRTGDMGTVLFIGDDQSELLKLILSLDDFTNCGLHEGINLQSSLGGVVVGA